MICKPLCHQVVIVRGGRDPAPSLEMLIILTFSQSTCCVWAQPQRQVDCADVVAVYGHVH